MQKGPRAKLGILFGSVLARNRASRQGHSPRKVMGTVTIVNSNNVCAPRDTSKEMKRQARLGEEVCKSRTDTGLLSPTDKALSKRNN